jgi:hypothetical protein
MDLKNNPSPLVRRLAGLGIACGGVFMTRLAWIQATRDGSFSTLGGMGGPAFAAIGIGLVLFKGYRQERLERGEDISQLEGLALLTPRWKAVLGVSLLAGLANFGLLSGWW